MIEAGLYTRLNTQLTGIGGRIYPKTMPQNVTLPAVTYELISDPRGNTHQGPDGTVEARYQVTTWSQSYQQAKTLSLQVKNALQGYRGPMGTGVAVASIFAAGGRDLFDDDLRIHYVASDFFINYKET
jgi:hypothetical protein